MYKNISVTLCKKQLNFINRKTRSTGLSRSYYIRELINDRIKLEENVRKKEKEMNGIKRKQNIKRVNKDK